MIEPTWFRTIAPSPTPIAPQIAAPAIVPSASNPTLATTEGKGNAAP